MKKNTISTALLVGLMPLLFSSESTALENGLARTPPMGFNTWNWFKCGSEPGRSAISATLIKEISEVMVAKGMRDSGYLYVNIDDCWAELSRDAHGGLVPNRTNFPEGMKKVADYVHSQGLKLGLYTDIADLTCQRTMPGLMGHADQDADSLVAWGIDFIKVDWCWVPDTTNAANAYAKFRDALKNAVERMKPTVPTAHDIVYSICNWGLQSPWLWGDTVGNLWRTTTDIDAMCNGKPCWAGIMGNMDGSVGLAPFAGPGHWNDPDMLQVGNMPLTNNENKAHFSLWCMMAAPLICGNDIRTMSDSTKMILTNGEVIRINQDSLGQQGVRVLQGSSEIWVKKLASLTPIKTDTNYAILFFNRNNGVPVHITADQIAAAVGGGIKKGMTYSIRDLWAHKDLSPWTADTLMQPASIPDRDVIMLRLTPQATAKTQTIIKPAQGTLLLHQKNHLVIPAGKSGQVTVSLLNLKGVLIYRKQFSGQRLVSISTSSLNRGSYIVTVVHHGECITQHIFVK